MYIPLLAPIIPIIIPNTAVFGPTNFIETTTTTTTTTTTATATARMKISKFRFLNLVF